jgi:hypothetical protein
MTIFLDPFDDSKMSLFSWFFMIFHDFSSFFMIFLVPPKSFPWPPVLVCPSNPIFYPLPFRIFTVLDPSRSFLPFWPKWISQDPLKKLPSSLCHLTLTWTLFDKFRLFLALFSTFKKHDFSKNHFFRPSKTVHF